MEGCLRHLARNQWGALWPRFAPHLKAAWVPSLGPCFNAGVHAPRPQRLPSRGRAQTGVQADLSLNLDSSTCCVTLSKVISPLELPFAHL